MVVRAIKRATPTPAPTPTPTFGVGGHGGGNVPAGSPHTPLTGPSKSTGAPAGRHVVRHLRTRVRAAPTVAPDQGRFRPPGVVTAVPRPEAGGGRDLGWLVFAVAALLVFGLNAASGWVRLRRRRIPPSDDDAASLDVEAELQEIIAEEQAKRKLRSQR